MASRRSDECRFDLAVICICIDRINLMIFESLSLPLVPKLVDLSHDGVLQPDTPMNLAHERHAALWMKGQHMCFRHDQKALRSEFSRISSYSFEQFPRFLVRLVGNLRHGRHTTYRGETTRVNGGTVGEVTEWWVPRSWLRGAEGCSSVVQAFCGICCIGCTHNVINPPF